MSPPAEHALISRRQLFTGIALLGASTLAACSRSSRAPTAQATLAPTRSGTPASPTPLSLLQQHGAVGDGKTDDTTALQGAFAALQPGQTLNFPAGKVFLHSDTLVVKTAGVTLAGSATLRATNEEHSALQIQAANVTITDLRLETPTTTKRWSTPDQHKLFVGSHDGVVIRSVVVEGSAAAGIFCLGATNFVIDRAVVGDTRADGIHMTFGSHSGTVTSPQLSRTGDDGVAVVSYLADGVECHDITVTSPQVRTTTGGRGISVVGGYNISYSDVDIDGSNAAAIYVACEGAPSQTYSVKQVSITGGVVTDANTNTSIDHGAILAYAGRSGGTVTDVTISGISVSGTRGTASRQLGVVADSGGALSAITFHDIKVGSGPPAFHANVPASDFSLVGVTLDNQPVGSSS